MKALVFEKGGIGDLRVVDLERPSPGRGEVLVRVAMAGVNPIDYATATRLSAIATPKPHIPGSEFAGVVEAVGEGVEGLEPGDRVVVYNRVFDASCDMCLAGQEMLCRRGGLVGLHTNGGFAEYAVVPARNVFKIGEALSWELAASLPIAALTSYHALRRAGAGPGDLVVVVGAGGNTGMFAVQLAKIMGATVVAISRKPWVKELGADYVASLDKAREVVEEASGGRMADIVVDPLGSETLPTSLSLLGANGRLVTFGVLTGQEVRVDFRALYQAQHSIIGSTGGTRRELLDLIGMAGRGLLKVRTWRTYPLEGSIEALEKLFAKERDGRIFIKP
ncbi:MAG: alcohol dehydrogenase catalytic domain-containing protein [Desulfurococcales archaeon]|nr:alcohol dehydrogenase catalytic domain-containing protein [Desulfurococcales archaeon]